MEKILEKDRINFSSCRRACLSLIFALSFAVDLLGQSTGQPPRQVTFTINGQVGTNQTIEFDSTANAWAIVSEGNKHLLKVPGIRLVTANGTTNYIPKFSLSNKLINSQISDNGTAVNVSNRLSVGFNSSVPGDASFYPLLIRASVPTAVSAAMQNTDSTGFTAFRLFNSNAVRVGSFGVGNPGTSAPFKNNLYLTTQATFANLILATQNVDRIRITPDGNVGIGNIAATYKLEVNGTGRFYQDVTYDANAIISTPPTSAWHAANKVYVDNKVNGAVSGTTGYLSKFSGTNSLGSSIIYENAGNIGIGTTNAVSRLTFASFRSNTEETVGINFHQALTTGGLPAYGIGMGPAATEGYLTYRSGEGSSSLFGHKWFVNAVEVMRVRGDGNFGIGVNPAYKLDVNGTGHFVGNTTFDANVLIATAPTSGTHATNKTYVDLKQTGDGDLTAISALSGTGFAKRTATDTWALVTPGISDITSLQASLDAKLDSSGVRGTSNYVPKFTATRQLRNSQIFDNGTSVGINTNIPDSFYKLDVNGNLKANSYNIGGASSYTLDIGLKPVAQNTAQIATSANTLEVFAFQSFVWNYISSMAVVQRMKLDATGLKIGAGTAAYSLDVTGTGNFSGNLSSNTQMSVPHIIGTGGTPSISAGTGAGTGPTVSISGTDLSGTITITAGTSPVLAGDVVTLTFASAFSAAPNVSITEASDAYYFDDVSSTNTRAPLWYLSTTNTTTTKLKMKTSSRMVAGQVYVFKYHIL